MTVSVAPAAGARDSSPSHGAGRLLRRLLRLVAIVVALVVLLVVLLAAVAMVRRGQTVQLPPPTGSLDVGRTEFALVDGQRPDPFLTDGSPRTLPIWLWYPATVAAGAATAPYVPAAWADAADKANGIIGVLRQDDRSVKTTSVAHVPMQGKPPVVILLPGLGPSIPDYTTLAEDLASRGYAVIGINMPGSSTVVEYPDGHVVYGTPKGNIDESLISNPDGWYASAAALTNEWVTDATFVVKTLKSTPPSVGPLDFSHLAYVGHSLGGAAAFELCRKDSSCAGAVDLDGTLWTDVRKTGLTAPGLILESAVWPDNCGSDVFCQRGRADFANVKSLGNVRIFVVDGSKHLNFTDAGVLFEPLFSQIGALGSIDGRRALTITRDAIGSFLADRMTTGGGKALDSAVAQYAELRDR